MSTAEATDRLAADGLVVVRDAPVGGQAVMEGVMMRGVGTWAVAVRKPLPEQLSPEGLDQSVAAEGEIEVQAFPFASVLQRRSVLRLPIVRGVVALGESMRIGVRALNISVNARGGEQQQELSPAAWAGVLLAGVALAVVLFFLIPVALTSLVKDQLGSAVLFWLVEGALRTAILIGYIALIARLRDLRRLFQYHGAEHKTIACYEASLPLTPANAQRFSRLHPRCGTSFLLIVMIVSVFVFAPVGLPAWYLLFATRVVGLPLIVGISFELIKAAGRNRRRRWVQVLMWPGLQLQRMTTREPDLDQLAVAIAALEAVLEVEDPRGASDAERVGMEVVA
jgi:uncharacterized protein YqhQ